MQSREELRAKLRAKIQEKKIGRSSRQCQEHVIDESLRKAGIDKDEFRKNLEIFQKMKPSEREQVLRKIQETEK